MDNSEYSVNTYQHYVMCFSLLLVHMYGMENSSVAAVLYWVLYRETEHPDRTEEARTGCRYTASTQFLGMSKARESHPKGMLCGHGDSAQGPFGRPVTSIGQLVVAP